MSFIRSNFFIYITGCFILLILHSVSSQSVAQTQPDSLYERLAEKGKVWQNGGEYDKAIVAFDSALVLARTLKNEKKEATMLDQLGKTYAWMGRAEEGLKNHLLALKITERTGDFQSQARVLKNIGALHVEQRDYKTGMQYYDKAESLARKINDTLLIADLTNNKGLVIESQGDLEKGIQMYLQAYKIYKALKNDNRIAMAANNIAIVYKNKGDFKNALHYMEEALQISEKLGNQWYTAANLTNIANVYSITGNFMKSIEYANRAIVLSRKIKAQEILVMAYMNLAYYKSDLKNYKEAFETMKIYDREKDSLFNKDRSEQMAAMREKYETDKKQDTIRLLEQQKKINELDIARKELVIREQNIYWGIGIAALIIVVSFAWLLYNRKKITEKARLEAEILRQEKEMQSAVYEAERAERIRIARDMHDELGSGLSKIAILTGNVSHKITGQAEIKADIENISRNSRALVANMGDLVWALNAEDASLDNLVARIREHTYDFLEDCNINFSASFPDEEIPVKTISKEVLRNTFLSYKEMLNNTVKHSKASKISIDMKTSIKCISIKVQDDGIGFDIENVRKNGNGLRNLRMRMEHINGKYILESDIGKGTISVLEVDLT